jgi:S1/P1 Nuclease
MRLIVFLVVLACLQSPALAWLDNGHMAISLSAWHKLTELQRRQSSEILKRHPHYDEFLKAERPPEVPEDQWVFMRASVWPDFVRNTHAEQYNKPTWHYVDMPYVPPYSKLAPPASSQASSVVSQIDWAAAHLQSDDQAVPPIALCWLLHLIGDIHQPNHAITLFSEEFPEGDRGGNLSLIRIENGESVKLHLFWDGLLGQLASWPGILRLSDEFAGIEKESAEEVGRQLSDNTTPLSWAQESFAAGQKYAYLDGVLRPANIDIHPREDNVPQVSAEYVKQATKVAQIRAVLAANRIAASLSKALSPAGK